MSDGLSRGNSKSKQFIKDSANNFVVIQFVDMATDFPSGTLAAAADGQQYVIDTNFATANAAWGAITGGADKAIIRYNALTSKWVTEFAPSGDSGASLYDQSSDTIFTFDATDWNIASGSGGGVKNFASSQASGYKAADLTQGNSGVFGTVGAGIQGVISQEKVAPLDGKKSFLYTAAATSQNDWFYFTVDIDLYARGGAIADAFDYTWDGEDNAIEVQIFDPTLLIEHSNELNVLKNTDNDSKKSRNSRTIYAHPDTQTQVLIGFQVVGAVTGGEKLTFDNFAVTDSIGVIGTGSKTRLLQSVKHVGNTSNWGAITVSGGGPNATSMFTWNDGLEFSGDNLLEQGFITGAQGTKLTAKQKCSVSGSLKTYTSGATQAAAFVFKLSVGELDYLDVSNNSLNPSGSSVAQATFDYILEEGESLWFTQQGGQPFMGLTMTATAEEEGLRFLQVPNGEKLKDTFGIRFPGLTVTSALNAGDIATDTYSGDLLRGTHGMSDPYEIVDRVQISSTGVYLFTMTAGFFAVPPVISGIVEGTENNVVLDAGVGVTVSSFQITTEIPNSSNQNKDFHLMFHRQEKTPDIIGVPVSIQGQTHEADSEIALDGVGAGASGVTQARRFTTLRKTIGSAITYIDSSIYGAEFHINSNGMYDIGLEIGRGGAGSAVAMITKNVTINLAHGTQNSEEVLATDSIASDTYDVNRGSCSRSTYLLKGDVIRCQLQNVTGAHNLPKFYISKIGTQPLLDGGLVEQPGFSMTVHQAAESANTHVLTWGNTLHGSDNDWFKFVNDAANGDYYEILEDGVFNLSASFGDSNGSAQEWGICVNAPAVTFSTINSTYPETVIATNRTPAQANATGSCSGSRRLYKGDKITVQYQGSLSVGAAPQEMYFNIAKVGQTVKYSSRVYKEDPIAYQQKFLPSSITANISNIASLAYNNLEIGKQYRVTINVTIVASNNNGQFYAHQDSGATKICQVQCQPDGSGPSDRFAGGASAIFTATDTVLKFAFSENAAATLEGDGTSTETWVQLEELPFHAQTSKWS